MAPKGKNKGGGGKKKAKGNQTAPGELSTQQKANITHNFDYYSKRVDAKQQYWKNSVGTNQTDAANAFWEELKQQHEAAHPSPPAVPGTPQVSDGVQAQGFLPQSIGSIPAMTSGTAPNRLAPPGNANLMSSPRSTTAEDSQKGLASDLESLSLDREGDDSGPELKEQDESGTELEEQVKGDATGEGLVNNEDTSRAMAPAAGPILHASDGIAHLIDIMDVGPNLDQTRKAKGAKFPIRTDFQNTTTNVFTNHFEVTIDDHATFHEFQVVGIPEGRSKRMNKMFMDTVIEKSPVLHGNQDFFATDSVKTIIAWKDMREDLNAAGSGNGDGEGWHLLNVQDGNDGAVAHLYLRHVRVVDTAGLKRYVASEPPSDDWNPMGWNESTTMDALNIVVSKCFGTGIVRTVANKFFVEGGWSPLGTSPLCTIRGYYFSTRPGMGKVLLNVNACTSAFFRPILLSELMAGKTIFGRDYPSMLTGLRVYIDYERGSTKDGKASSVNNEESRIKRICALGLPCNTQTFSLKKRDDAGNDLTEQSITIKDYLESEYDIKLGNPELDAVNLGSQQRPSWFAPEKLVIMPYQVYRRAVPSRLTSDMLRIACNGPRRNRELIEGEGMSKLLLQPGAAIAGRRDLPLTISKSMLKVDCSQLPYPKIRYGDQSYNIKPADAKWNLGDKQFLSTKNHERTVSYTVLHERSVDATHIDQIRQNFEVQLTKLKVGNATHLGTHQLSTNVKGLQSGLRKAQQQKVDLVILVLRSKDQEVYSNFKYLADRVFGIPSIVMVTASNFRGGAWNVTGLDQYIGNIMMKANLKLGGINHSAESDRGNIKNHLENTLVLGSDVTHPSNGSLFGCPSVAALVGSVDNTGGCFLGSLRLQDQGSKEMIDDLKSMVVDRLWDWFSLNKRKHPKNILYYRDGVGDSQFEEVRNKELVDIRDGYDQFVKEVRKASFGRDIEDPPPLKLTAVVCTKRHHTRFYPNKPADMQTNAQNNCKAGTLVEQSVTNPYFTDFYLQSHNGIKGTAKPAHYFVLVNEMEIGVSDLQHLTYNLCLSYVRATMGVSYAAPAYYADRLCERARCYLRDFFVPQQSMREEVEAQRRQFEKSKGIRPPKDMDNMSFSQKEQERARVKQVKEEIDGILRKMKRTSAQSRLDARSQEQDYCEEKCEALRKTMYWM
ncbi:hypothetical protein HBI27_098380 [Parastagonospora nodorum]|nr:hypothetical protein HBI27_098380 [Parastagonospora nodorum]